MASVVAAYREEWGRVVATLVRQTGDWDLAEECSQGAFERALQKWPIDGVPDRPGAWLLTVARNAAIDRLRRDARHAVKMHELVTSGIAESSTDIETTEARTSDELDERLQLIFTCCHPALALDARVALTLRTLTGLSTAQIARAFLVPESTMAKRLARTKHKISNAGIPYRVPIGDALAERTSGVLAVIYLVFNEGYTASAGSELVRVTLCDLALDLARLMAHLMPDEPETKGLVALILLQHSRRRARVDANGDVVTLQDQDRALWDVNDIAEAERWLVEANTYDSRGVYQVQAAIAQHHARATSTPSTDWNAIVELYDQLVGLTGSPVVELNRAVAVAMCDGPAKALKLVEQLSTHDAMKHYYLLAATRADFLRRLGRRDEAASEYRAALELVGSEPERRFLQQRLADVAT
jgi:RNA polymerase sigma-70 factor (ECF subfamily)